MFTPDAPPARRETVMQVMRAWSQGLKFGAVAVAWQPWVLEGEASTWAAQLQARQARTPVFGLVSGAGGAQWEAVQQFCEQQRIACLFPSLDRIPHGATPPRYTVYLSAGVDGEAHMLAQLLAEQRGKGGTVQAIGRGAAASGAAQTLAAALRPPWRVAAISDGSAPLPRSPAVQVLWLGSEDAAAWLRGHTPVAGQPVYLSAQLAPPQSVDVPAAWRGQLKWLSMRAAPAHFRGALATALDPWAQALTARPVLAPADFADAYMAGYFFGDAAGLAQGVLRPDYLIERLETALQRRPVASIYLHASLGPGQRVASKGGYVLGWRQRQQDGVVAQSGYLRATP